MGYWTELKDSVYASTVIPGAYYTDDETLYKVISADMIQ